MKINELPGMYLEFLTWPEAEIALKSEYEIVLLPIGARLKEHGHHLPLNNDWILAEYFTKRIMAEFPVLALPTLQYNYYPAFTEYPGSININQDTSEQLVIDICQSLANHGAKKFFILNTGVSTNWALEPARIALGKQNILMEYTDLLELFPQITHDIKEQTAGTHADEIETSMMLYITPEVVNMPLAKKDIPEDSQPGGLTRDPKAKKGIYSPSGVWGDPTLASEEKGKKIVERFVKSILELLDEFSKPDFNPREPNQKYLERPKPVN